MTEFWLYLTFVFALIELYIIINVKLMVQIRYGRGVFVALLVLLVASPYVKPHFVAVSLYILGVLYLYICILRLKFGKKSEI